MIYLNTMELLRRHTSLPCGWNEVVVGYDFGILSVREIQDWIHAESSWGPAAEEAAKLEGQDLLRFESCLWAAYAEAMETGVPRPGHLQWTLAQDLWRITLLKEVLDWSLSEGEFGEAIETIFNRMGCPEDMLGFLKLSRGWAGRPASADHPAVAAFIHDLENRCLLQSNCWITLAAS